MTANVWVVWNNFADIISDFLLVSDMDVKINNADWDMIYKWVY